MSDPWRRVRGARPYEDMRSRDVMRRVNGEVRCHPLIQTSDEKSDPDDRDADDRDADD